MVRSSIRNVLTGISLAALLLVLPGCNPAAPLERAGIELAPPATWHRDAPRRGWSRARPWRHGRVPTGHLS